MFHSDLYDSRSVAWICSNDTIEFDSHDSISLSAF